MDLVNEKKKDCTWTAAMTEQYVLPRVDLVSSLYLTLPDQQLKPILLMLTSRYDLSVLCEVRAGNLET